MTTADWKLLDGFDRRTTPARPDLAAAGLRGIIASTRYAEGRLMRLNCETAPLRARPDEAAAWDTQVLFGEDVLVFDEADGWAWVQLLQDGYVGYLGATSLAPAQMPITHKVQAPRTFVYPSANIKLPPIMALPLGAQVTIAHDDGTFAQVRGLVPGPGFIWSRHLRAHDADESDLVDVARRFLFAPYLWGGKTSLGLDCSGLIQIALQACGIPCPRDSDMIGRDVGQALDPAAALRHARRGDLFFWQGHVGMMSDDETLLHANGFHMQVVEEPLAQAVARIKDNSFGLVTGARRLEPLPRVA
ncbi:NlpC/P60 family protein [Roseiarcaceae bacterium H3SJ34-1]|uniref:C40 family peptidase n=1 Tax=Terripilifer ovatus TaxID=3032367 RepID=UPI003AB94ADB|nr:NlpC/P60 family protein [Roseiarcaceae bacterium H3SJ34-1]